MMNNKGEHISFGQASKLMRENDVKLVDVKTRNEYAKFHLNNSINIPVEEIARIAPSVLKNKNEIIIVYCSSGVRSLAAFEILLGMGYTRVYDITDGIDR